MSGLRFLSSVLAWAAVHMLACMLIVPTTLKAGSAGLWITGALNQLTKVLYFPVIGLALYPRHWFPGNWIYIPIALNSLLWGLFLALSLLLVRRLRRNMQTDA
jgi:hypothetical protein